MASKVSGFPGIYYSKQHHSVLSDLIVPAWNADELWGAKSSDLSFRNTLVGTSEECGVVWNRWMQGQDFAKDSGDHLYVLRHTFHFRSKEYVRWATFVACSIESDTFLTHEKISPEGAENARERYAACKADLTPIFAGVSETKAKIYRSMLEEASSAGEQILSVVEDPGAEHILWRISEEDTAEKIISFLEQEQLYLLDGHHRWQAAQRNKEVGEGDGRILACVSSFSADDLLILPIHRALVKDEWLLPQNSVQDMERLGCTIVSKVKWQPDNVEDIVQSLDASAGRFYFLPVQSAELYEMSLPEDLRNGLAVEGFESVCRRIDNLHLVPVFGLPLLIEELASGQAQAAAFLPPITANEVRAIADRDATLPRKSTRFFPKPAIGLVSRAWLF